MLEKILQNHKNFWHRIKVKNMKFATKELWGSSPFADSTPSASRSSFKFPKNTKTQLSKLLTALCRQPIYFAEKGYIDLESLWKIAKEKGIKRIKEKLKENGIEHNIFKGKKIIHVYIDLTKNLYSDESGKIKPNIRLTSTGESYYFYGQMAVWCNKDLLSDSEITYDELSEMSEEEVREKNWSIPVANVRGFLKEEDYTKINDALMDLLQDIQQSEDESESDAIMADLKNASIFMMVSDIKISEYEKPSTKKSTSKKEEKPKIYKTLEVGTVDLVIDT